MREGREVKNKKRNINNYKQSKIIREEREIKNKKKGVLTIVDRAE